MNYVQNVYVYRLDWWMGHKTGIDYRFKYHLQNTARNGYRLLIQLMNIVWKKKHLPIQLLNMAGNDFLPHVWYIHAAYIHPPFIMGILWISPLKQKPVAQIFNTDCLPVSVQVAQYSHIHVRIKHVGNIECMAWLIKRNLYNSIWYYYKEYSI